MKLFLSLLLICSCCFSQEGEWKYVDGWVYTAKKEDATAGGAIIQKKIENPIINNVIENTQESNIKQETITKYAPCRGGFVTFNRTTTTYKSGEFFGLPFEVRTVHSGAKTPEPSSSSLFLFGLLSLFAYRNRRK